MHDVNRYDALVERHRRLEARLAAEVKRPLPDWLVLQLLKRQKLKLRDQMAACRRIADAPAARPVLPGHGRQLRGLDKTPSGPCRSVSDAR